MYLLDMFFCFPAYLLSPPERGAPLGTQTKNADHLWMVVSWWIVPELACVKRMLPVDLLAHSGLEVCQESLAGCSE